MRGNSGWNSSPPRRRSQQAEAESLSTLVPRYLHAAHKHAEGRYRSAANAVLGGRTARDVTADPAWGAVVAKLYDAEARGWRPAQLLAAARQMRELGTADSIAEVLAWRIDTILTTKPVPTEATPASPVPTRKENLLPWLASPQPVGATGLAAYLNDAANVIATRVAELAERAIRERPAWMTKLGQEPAAADARDQWRQHIAVIAAYRDQHQITTDDPRQVLGPYPEPGHAGQAAYQHAAESVLAVRRLSGLDQPQPSTRPAGQASARRAADRPAEAASGHRNEYRARPTAAQTSGVRQRGRYVPQRPVSTPLLIPPPELGPRSSRPIQGR